MNDRFDVKILGGDQGEAIRQIEAHLMAEDAERAGIGPVILMDSVFPNTGEEIEILTQG